MGLGRLADKSMTFYTSEKFLRRGGGEMTKLAVSDDDSPSTFADQLLLKLRKQWQPVAGGPTYPAGALLSFKVRRQRCVCVF